VKILSHPLSTFSRRVHIAVIEKQLELPFETVDMAHREHRSEAFRAINPYGRVPVLIDEDFVLYESIAILEYLEGRYPKPALIPEGLEDRAHMMMHMRLCDLELATHTGALIFPKRFIPEDRWRREEMAQASASIAKHFAILEQHLHGKTYLVGEQFTLADLCYIPFLHFLPLLDTEPGPNLIAWHERLKERPSAVATAPEK